MITTVVVYYIWKKDPKFLQEPRAYIDSMTQKFKISYVMIFAGMDAEISYGFHSERKKNPEKFKNQLTNQVYYILIIVHCDDFFCTVSLCCRF